MGEYEKLNKENSQLKEEIDLLTKKLERYKDTEPNGAAILKAVEHSLGGIAITDRKWNLKYVNPAVLEMWGYSSEAEMIGRKLSDFYFKKDLEDIEEANKTLTERGSWQGELTGQKKSGEPFSFLISLSAVKDKKGEVTDIVTSFIDITKYKDALRDIAKSEIRYRATLDNMEDIIYVVNKDLNITLINDALIDWNRETGLKAGKLVGQNIFDVLPFLEDRVRDEYNLVFEKKQIVITEDEYFLKGKRFVMETRKIPVSEEGEVYRIVTIMRDITVKKVVEEELQRSEEKYRLIADNVPVGIFIHIDGKVIYCGREGAHLLL